VVRSAGSAGPNNGRSCATRPRSTDAECSQPTRSAITVAGISGNSLSNDRIRGSNASTFDPAGARTYRGGTSEANAARTVFRANPKRRAIVLIPNFSDLCNRRISAQSSTLITPSLCPRGVKLHSAARGQCSLSIDNFPAEQAALKCVYLAIMSLDPTGRGRKRWTNRWKAVLNAFEITFDGRLSATTK